MGEKLPRVTADEIIRVLKKAGFVKVGQSGSHQKWYHFETGKQTIVAYHRGDIIRPKTFKRILEGAGISVAEFQHLRGKKK
jgi:predicted RNA binding protein YcfA (HicA-like mRNA interferase family)